MNLILTIGIFIAFFQFVLLLNKKNKAMPDKILAFWMLTFSIHLLGFSMSNVFLDIFAISFPLLYPVFFYLYTAYSLENKNQFNKKDFIHFAPTVIAQLCLLFIYLKQPYLDKTNYSFGIYKYSLLLFFMISVFVYSYLSLKNLKIHHKLLEKNFSNDNLLSLNWFKSLIWGILFMFLLGLLSHLLLDYSDYTFLHSGHIFFSSLVLFIILVGYYGIRHQNIFIDNTIVEVVGKNTKSEYKKSGLKEVVAQHIYNHLLLVMKEQKPYLEPKLTLSNLAKRLDISPNILSQIINQYENKNFNDFVNKYRIKEFIQRASTNNQYSFLAHALDSGFNSKSTFNGVFKKQKGVTPSQFMSNFKN